jgi:amino acid permease
MAGMPLNNKRRYERRERLRRKHMKMILIGGVLMAALLVAVVSSIKADGPHWVAADLVADAPARVAAPQRANGA